MHEHPVRTLLGRRLSLRETLLSLGLGVPVLLYAILCFYAWFFSEALIFQPPKPHYRDTGDIIKLPVQDGVSISARYLANPQARFTILYSHGQSEDLGDSAEALTVLRRLGVAVFTYDYEGYGTSEGRPSEARAYRDIDAAYDYLTGTLNVPSDRIIAYGFSLGSGPAVDLASRKPVAGLILESAFASAFRTYLPVQILPFDRFDNLGKIARVSRPVLILHGMRDALIPVRQAEQLFQAARGPKRLVVFKDMGHFGIKWDPTNEFARALEAFLASIGKRHYEARLSLPP